MHALDFLLLNTWNVSRNCESGSIDFNKIRGKILLCFNEDKGGSFKAVEIIDGGGIGVIFIDDDLNIEPDTDYPNVTHPISAVRFEDGYDILSYMHSYR